MKNPNWGDMEAAFRHMAFRVYYERCYASEKNLMLRFAKALVASTQPIADPQAVAAWYNAAGDRENLDQQITALAEATRKRLGRPKPFEARGGWQEHGDTPMLPEQRQRQEAREQRAKQHQA